MIFIWFLTPIIRCLWPRLLCVTKILCWQVLNNSKSSIFINSSFNHIFWWFRIILHNNLWFSRFHNEIIAWNALSASENYWKLSKLKFSFIDSGWLTIYWFLRIFDRTISISHKQKSIPLSVWPKTHRSLASFQHWKNFITVIFCEVKKHPGI